MKVRVLRRPAELILDCGNDRGAVLDLLDPEFSFFCPGAEWSEHFDRGHWDGVRHLVKRVRGNAGLLQAPPGLLPRLIEVLATVPEMEVEIIDRRSPVPWEEPGGSWEGFKLFPFQEEAVLAATTSDGGGILHEPIRSGKTLIAAAITYALGQKTIFIAPSDFLVAQARDVFRACLGGRKITLVGLGFDDWSGDVVIASIATLAARRGTSWWDKARKMFGVVFIDELHHLLAGGEEWRAVAEEIEVYYRFGLTGTLDVEADHIRLSGEAICGRVIHQTEMKALVALGRIVPLKVSFVRHDSPKLHAQGWQAARSGGIADCPTRNKAIASRAREWAQKGEKVLIDCGLIGHSRRLLQLLSADRTFRSKVRLLTGSSPQSEREDVLRDFRRGEVSVVISTVLGEGVDIPELGVVINAEGGSVSPSAIQRLRSLTPYPGKKIAYLDDFVDIHHPILAAHTKARLGLYRSKGFKVEVV